MSFEKTFIPYGAYWSSPFCRWQGSIGHLHAMHLAAQTATKFFAGSKVPVSSLDGIALGITVHQQHSFYGAPWLAGMLGAPELTGPTLSQACATSARVLLNAALEVECGLRECMLGVACDRTSNGPHVYYPNPKGMGGTGDTENPVIDNFSVDPFADNAMIETAEKVAKAAGIGRAEQDEMALLRAAQYEAALADDRAFQKRYMVGVDLMKRKKVVGAVEADEGIHPTTADGLAGLRPVMPDGTVTFGTQTHPADGNAGIVVCGKERAAELSKDGGAPIQLLSYAEARVDKGMMPMAVVPAAQAALERAGYGVDDCGAIKTHNPFAVNDVYFCREMGLSPDKCNAYGSPLVYGHPQAPTGLRAIIELIEQLAQTGGGIGLFSGCAAGDTAAALVLKVA
ncbi:MAG: thiolase family protein [Deltaproteobacteria bacterium]|jgi:acetyl-CoA acetyltransferase|nr:thiolase family protein [Deltaproteobacteria bacterium]MBW2535843.1 thiolase family protein [Deltaproteobacteria bacterium]